MEFHGFDLSTCGFVWARHALWWSEFHEPALCPVKTSHHVIHAAGTIGEMRLHVLKMVPPT